MRSSGPSSRRSTAGVLVALFGPLLLLASCVDKTPPPLWPTPPPPPMATPIGVTERRASAGGGQGSEHEEGSMKPEVAAPAVDAPAAHEPETSPQQQGALGPWQPARTHR
ncbi:hypothetical protein SAMN02745121_02189 [Nannocystis exedens]|uniref:Lipoprotein n=1 Tax=Nannocystis exedens TaxID=54 RepID=A0A1I1WBU0_9BACT|nr:hypothetical protein [Nannocystis exedens]PCC67553.1 hypothetical protein NAEX_00560 [Nannocystis exedens]SFD91858.1 hypothetical protein SAMN02745121_02189 [Nannocystis exedens]